MPVSAQTLPVAIVLSGGGARGAYEAGAVAGIVDVLGAGAAGPGTFEIVSGASVGAINGAWLAANAHRADHDAQGLVKLWSSLELTRHMRLELRALLKGPFRDPERFGRSLFDPRPFEELIEGAIDWPRLHDNVERGLLRAFIVSALHVGTGVTTLFTELAPSARFSKTDHPRRVSRAAKVGPEHVLASAAIPVLFPARRIGGGFFADGGLRFNTPISPALRAGAGRLVVVTLRDEASEAPRVEEPGASAEAYPDFVFLAGKVLNALLLDPVADDFETLQHLNAFVRGLEVLPPEARARVDAALTAERGRPYRKIETLHLSPSRNIGLLAAEHLRAHAPQGGPLARRLWSRAASGEGTWEADLASYLLFDGGWTARLCELGRADAHAQREEILAFFR